MAFKNKEEVLHLLNDYGELEEIALVGFSKSIANSLFRRYVFPQCGFDDIIQYACLIAIEERANIEGTIKRNAFVYVKSKVLGKLDAERHFRAKKAKVFYVKDDALCLESRGNKTDQFKELEALDLLKTAMNRACIPREAQELLKRYVDDSDCFFIRENIARFSPAHTRFLRDRRAVAEMLAKILKIPVPKNKIRNHGPKSAKLFEKKLKEGLKYKEMR